MTIHFESPKDNLTELIQKVFLYYDQIILYTSLDCTVKYEQGGPGKEKIGNLEKCPICSSFAYAR